jgi:Sugar kinases, ribokinase family
MKVLNFGSLNLDFVYAVDHIVLPGETILSSRLDVFPGGKGLNQAVGLARAGAAVDMAGSIGPDGAMLRDVCRDNNIGDTHLRRVDERTGNAIIQVAATGQNSIVLFGGANRKNDTAFIDTVLSHYAEGDMLVMQNEINLAGYLIDQAHRKGMTIALNPSPFNEDMAQCDLSKVSIFLINEVEGCQITGQPDPDAILANMRIRFPEARVVLTLGGDGAIYQDKTTTVRESARSVSVVDTTAAGDTFAGYFLTAFAEGLPPAHALALACDAAAIAVSRSGASVSIPRRDEVECFRPTRRRRASARQ